MVKHNKICPKCKKGHVVGVIFTDKETVKEQEKSNGYWTDMGTACDTCDWEIQLRSSNP